MISLSTTDNNLGKTFSQMGCAPGDAKSAYCDLSRIANAPLGELAKANPNLLVFPKVLGDNKDDVDELPLFIMAGSGESEGELAKVKVTTVNLMGFVGSGETQLEITSRFTPHEPGEPKEDYFLHYMLEKIFALNLFDLKHLAGSGTFDFLLFLFPSYLQKALTQGIYKTYQHFQKNDANLKGAVDMSRHIKENIPFRGRISYNTRERSCDNDMTELIRHAIEVIKAKSLGKTILFRNEESRRAVEAIVAATPSYNAHERERILSRNAKPVSHPYFTKYRPLQKICLAILRHEKLKYGSDSKQIYGILFDGAWLWEEYLATILSKCGFKHPRNKESTGGIYVWKGNPRYPDFYRGEQIKAFHYGEAIPVENEILDAKYKRLENASIGRDDIHQLITYMHILPAKRGGLMYPYGKADAERIMPHLLLSASHKVYGLGGEVSVYGFPIPQKTAYTEFADFMNDTENATRRTFMRYSFYNWQSAIVPPVNPLYPGIMSPRDLYDVLSHIWCVETCAPRMRAKWSEKNKTCGQCSITAFLAQDIFGGKVYGIPREGGTAFHCYNVVPSPHGDCVFDLTSEQFGDEQLCYEGNPEQFREVHFTKEEKRARYELLSSALAQFCAKRK